MKSLSLIPYNRASILSSVAFVSFGLTPLSDAAISVYLNGDTGSNVISYTVYGQITAEVAIADAGDSGFARFPSTDGSWVTGADNALGNVLQDFGSSLNDDLPLSLGINVEIRNASGGIVSSGNWNTIDLDPVGASDDIEFDPTVGFAYPSIGVGGALFVPMTTGTFTLESGTYDTILNEGSFFSPVSDSNGPIYEVFVGVDPVPEPSSALLLSLSGVALLARRRRS